MQDINDKTSMLYWFPKIKDLGIKIPRTEIVPFKWSIEDLCNYFESKHCDLDFETLTPEYYKTANIFGYPIFIRTDYTSHKHDWIESCFVQKEENLQAQIKELLYFSLCADIFGLDINAIVFREYIPMKNLFIAFNGMPVNPEYRIFIKDGEVICHHWYWIEDAIQNNCEVEGWEKLITEAKKTYEKDIPLLTKYAKKVAEQFEGFWSVDFCLSAENEWILIDMAEGEKSWHPECQFKKER